MMKEGSEPGKGSGKKRFLQHARETGFHRSLAEALAEIQFERAPEEEKRWLKRLRERGVIK